MVEQAEEMKLAKGDQAWSLRGVAFYVPAVRYELLPRGAEEQFSNIISRFCRNGR